MSSEENELARAVREFNATVDALMRPGVSWIAELAQLKILISKYPRPAAKILSEQCPADAISEPPTRHEGDRPCQSTSVRSIQGCAKDPPGAKNRPVSDADLAQADDQMSARP